MDFGKSWWECLSLTDHATGEQRNKYILKKNDCGIFKCINGPTNVDVNNTGIDKSDSGTISCQNNDRSQTTGLLDGESLFH